MPSRYGPPGFVEDHSGELLGNALTNAASTFIAKRRQKTLDQERQREGDVRDYTAGYRSTAPQGQGPDRPPINPRAAIADPAMQDLATHLMGNLHVETPKAPAPAPPGGPALASALDAPAGNAPPSPAGAAPHDPTDPGPMPSPSRMSSQPPPGGHPGAFDPTIKSFGSSSLAAIIHRSRTPERYTALPHGGFIDNEATPRAESARDRAMQLALAEEFRSRDIAQRGSQAVGIEGMRENAAGARTTATNTSRAQLSKDHDERMLARIHAGEKPTMIGGNPYLRDPETGAWEPAVDSEGKALTVENVPQKPMTAAQRGTAAARTTSQDRTADTRKIATVSAQINSTQRQMSAVTASVNAATYAAPGSPEKKAAEKALASLPGLKQRLDSLTAVRDKMAATQQGAGHEGGATDTSQPVTQEEYDAAHAAGWSDAKIETKYGKLSPDIKRKPVTNRGRI